MGVNIFCAHCLHTVHVYICDLWFSKMPDLLFSPNIASHEPKATISSCDGETWKKKKCVPDCAS